MLLLVAPPTGRWGDAVRWATECRELFRVAGNRAMEVDTLGQHATALLMLGRLPEAEAFAREAHALAQTIENPWGLISSKFTLAMVLLTKGDDADALVLARDSFTLAEWRAVPVLSYVSAIAYAIVLREAGDLAEARRVLESTRALPSFQPFTDQTLEQIAITAASAGDWGAAAEILLPLLPDRNESMNIYRGLDRDIEIEALLGAGEVDLAIEDVRTFEEHTAQSPRFRIIALRCRAAVEHYQRHPDAAQSLLDEAATLARDLNLPLEQRRVEAARARLAR
jgi:hypothetical protein